MTVPIMKLTRPKLRFKIAGSMAFQECVRRADPVILEPIMKVVAITLRNSWAM